MITGALALAPEIEEFKQQFEQLARDADCLVGPLSDRQFTWKPEPDAWSVAQCIDHLNVTARLYLPVLDEGIADAIRRGLYGAGPHAYNWFGKLAVQLVAPQTRFKSKAREAFQPPEGRSRHDVMSAFGAYQVQFVDRLRGASGLDLARSRVRSPLWLRMRMPLGSGFAMMIAHERRHLEQARRVIGSEDFPRG